jgi:ribosomal protein L11 methylase PrmA
MNTTFPDSGSFRDPSGRIYHHDDRVYRTVMPPGREHFEFVRSTGLIDELVSSGQLVAESVVDVAILGEASARASFLLEHPRLPFVSYPYEWSFSALKSAALMQLDIHLKALAHGVTLSDATAYNIQFVGSEPVFIDALSFRKYQDGEYWSGHSQFCEQFLNPLLFESKLGVAFNAWYRGSLDGIRSEEIDHALAWYRKLSLGAFANVVMQARFQRQSRGNHGTASGAVNRPLPVSAFKALLQSLRRWISRMEPREIATDWQGYAESNSYAGQEKAAKSRFVADFVEKVSPSTLWDIGCNTGDYSVLAIESGAQFVVGFDFDHKVIEAAYRRARASGVRYLPLVIDAVNPSPSQGWAQAERKGLNERGGADAVLALALVHHLAIAKNIPLEDTVAWLVSLARHGVVEFVQKSDPMVCKLLQFREDIFEDYGQEAFEACLSARARIIRKEEVSASGRTLYWYERN